MPRVSIVIPTRNRAHLLRVALQSALRQTWQDLEILVSDNYCGNEETRSVYESFHDSRLRYVRTDSLLAMPDSWEFALSHAKGEYVTFLTDDSYLFSFALERAMAAIAQHQVDLVAWNNSAYFALDWLQPFQRNLLYVDKPPYPTTVLSSQTVLRELFDLQISPHIPRFMYSVCHQRLVAKMLEVQGRMFFPPCPDYSAAVSLLLNTDKYVFVGWPLAIDGGTNRSIGYAAMLKNAHAFQEFLAEFKEAASFRELIDLDLVTLPVLIAQSIENVRRRFYSERIPYQVNRRNLLCQSIESVATYERYGANVADEWRVLDEFLARQPEDIRRAGIAQRRRSKLRSLLLTPVGRMLHRFPGWEHLESLRGQYIIYRGDNHCFHNMEQCGEVAPRLIAEVAGANANETSKGVGESYHGPAAHPS
ncbi:MAG: glycosyltransferase family 2 protein [Terriglobia bacterium]